MASRRPESEYLLVDVVSIAIIFLAGAINLVLTWIVECCACCKKSNYSPLKDVERQDGERQDGERQDCCTKWTRKLSSFLINMLYGDGTQLVGEPSNQGDGTQRERGPSNQGDGTQRERGPSNQGDGTQRERGPSNQEDGTQREQGPSNQEDGTQPEEGPSNQEDNTINIRGYTIGPDHRCLRCCLSSTSNSLMSGRSEKYSWTIFIIFFLASPSLF